MIISNDEAAEMNTRLVIATDLAGLVARRLRYVNRPGRRVAREGGWELATRLEKATLELASVADAIAEHRQG